MRLPISITGYLRHLPNQPANLAVLLAVTFAAYWSGVDSGFLFDDFPNLDALTHLRGEPLFSPGFWEFVLAGDAGPAGRPVSLITFALQAQAWPDNPGAFKLVNLGIHAVNAVLVYLVCRQLAAVLKTDTTAGAWLTLCAAAFWALHPIHTTVVLYAVQRMALLSNLFILLALYCHLRIRLSAAAGNAPWQLVLLTLSLGAWGLLSLFSKENAPSLVFYLLVLEVTLLHGFAAGPLLRRWRLVCLWLPVAILLLLPLVFAGRLQESFQALYPYGIAERLLTQGRVLWHYAGVILFPSTAGSSLFHDVEVSASLFAPLTTALSLLAWAALLAAACLKPGPQRLWPFALGWFFAGHVIESTVLPLEPWFNHRNYLAIVGPLLAVLVTISRLAGRIELPRFALPAVAVLYALLLTFQTASISTLWRDPLRLAETWYTADPGTARNAEFLAINLAATDIDGLRQAAAIYEETYAREPENFRLLLNRMTLSCATSFIPRPDDATIRSGLARIGRENRDLLSPLQQLVTLATSNQCNIYSIQLLEDIFVTLMEAADPLSNGLYQFELARLAFAAGNDERAYALLESSYGNTGDPGVLFTLALRLANAGRYAESVDVIDRAIERLGAYNDIRTGTRAGKLALLGEMRDEVAAMQDSGE